MLRKEVSEINRKILVIVLAFILLGAGAAYAAYTWISNLIYTTVTVTPYVNMEIIGSFPTTQIQNIAQDVTFNYEITAGSPTGYIVLTFKSFSFVDTSGVTIIDNTVYVWPTGLVMYEICTPIASYPQIAGDTITWVFALESGDPIPFKSAGTSTGTINMALEYEVVDTVFSSIRVSATPP